VEDDYQNAVDGKDLIDFKPTDKDLSYTDSKDTLKTPKSSKYSYLFFRESADEFVDMENGPLGIDYTASKMALENHIGGDSEGMEELLEKASEVNGITPEHVSELLIEFISLN
jgi:hypothetical protein